MPSGPCTSGTLPEGKNAENVLDEIVQHGYRRVALQFPDSMLSEAPSVFHLFIDMAKIAQDDLLFFIVGDTSYGSCCVDEVSAAHLNADVLVHYGPSCLSRTSRLPVLNVFGSPRHALDCHHCSDSILRALGADDAPQLLIFYDLVFAGSMEPLTKLLQEREIRVRVAQLLGSGMRLPEACMLKSTDRADSSRTRIRGGGLQLVLDDDEFEDPHAVIVYIGACGSQLSNIMMRLHGCKALTYDPSRPQGEELSWVESSISRTLKRRYYLVQKVKDAEVVGIVLGTLGVSRYLDILDAVTRLIRRAGKKHYIFVVGKITPAKLANFAEVQAFVLIACPEASLLDSRDFHAPVVTPMELEIALGTRQWDGFYSTDFRDLKMCQEAKREAQCAGEAFVEGAEGHQENQGGAQEKSEADMPYFSLVSGTYKSQTVPYVPTKMPIDDPDSRQLLIYESPAADFLQNRVFKGLGQDGLREGEGEGRNSKEQLLQGRRGIAANYCEV